MNILLTSNTQGEVNAIKYNKKFFNYYIIAFNNQCINVVFINYIKGKKVRYSVSNFFFCFFGEFI